MRFFMFLGFCVAQIFFTTSKIMPKRLPRPCSKSLHDYSDCTFKFLQQMGPHLLKGVRALNFPNLQPLNVPLFIVNRTVNELVSIDAVLTYMQISGYDTVTLNSFKFDTENMAGELQMNFKLSNLKFSYDNDGRVLVLKLNDTGFFDGNFTNVDFFFKFSLKEVDKIGVKYYAYKDFSAQGTVGDGSIKLVAKNPEGQAAADVVTNFFNDYPNIILDAMDPILTECYRVFFKALSERVLNSVPAKELIPE